MENMVFYYFDIGSSTIKMYEYKGKKAELIEERSILFKAFFSEESGVSTKNYLNLMTFIRQMKERYTLTMENTKILATGIWRRIPEEQLATLKADFRSLNLEFNVISHEQESRYFAKAMQGIYDRKKIVMVNMGGKTTELVAYDKGNIVNKKNLDIGVADVLNHYPRINELEEKVTVDKAIAYIKTLLPNEAWEKDFDAAIYTGAELRFQRLTQYPLVENTIFKDNLHPVMVSLDDFKKRNREIVEATKMKDLYELMPTNPGWMEGAKAGVCLAEAIFDWLAIKWIIPSDLNMIEGVVKMEQRYKSK